MNNEILKMRLNHTGQIGFRLSLFGLIVCLATLLASLISLFLTVVVAMVGFLLPIITLGLPLVFDPNYFSNLSELVSGSNSIISFFGQVINYVKYVAIIGILGSILGSIFLLWDKNDRQWGKFVFCIVSIVLCLIIFILISSGTFAN